jgi:hypothetical protein
MKKICIAQSAEELKFILNNVKKDDVSCIPLNLSTQLFCINNKIKFYNPINYIDEDFHKKALADSENLISKISVSNLKFESHIKEYKAIMRFKFNSAVFLLELIEKIDKYEKIEEIIVSGWNQYIDQYSLKNYFVSSLISSLINNIKILKLTKPEKEEISKREEIFYEAPIKKLNKNKKYILMNNVGYNFKRIVFYIQRKNYHIIVPIFEKVGFLKKYIFKILKITFLEFKNKSSKQEKNILIPDIEFFYKEKDLSNILNFRKNQEIGNLVKLQSKSKAIDNLFDKLKIKLTISNSTRGIDGYYLEKSKKENIPSICIPHGTLAPFFDKFDKIYKNIIAEAITLNESKYLAVQSKITSRFIELNNLNRNTLKTGNLIFSESKNKPTNKILFAVTLKDFNSFQFLGVEMYYEFLDNLYLFNKLAKSHNFNFLIKLHPSANNCFEELKKTFKNLEFTKKKISNVLEKVFVTVSFSSTVIEDSLHSKVPVILLDRWKRYKHCISEENVNKKKSAIYYVNNESDLIQCFSTIKNNEDVNFDEHIFSNDVKTNVSNLINKFI